MRLDTRLLYVAIICLLGLPATLWSLAANAEPNANSVTLGTATKGGGFELFGQAFAEVINGTQSNVHVETLPTKGSKENLTLLEQGKVDMGLVEGNAARQALDGIGRDPARLQVLSVMYPNPGMFVVRADSPYHTIDDLKGHPIAFGTRASGLRILVGDVLDGIGLKPDQDFEAVILDKAGDGPGLVLEQQVAALWGAGIGWPGFVKVADSPSGARFIAPSADQISQIRQRHPHLRLMSVPAGTYKGQDTQIDSVGLWSLVLVRPDLPEETGYRLARAIHQGEAALGERLKQGRYTTAQNTVKQVAVTRLHPGAVRYYREVGLLP